MKAAPFVAPAAERTQEPVSPIKEAPVKEPEVERQSVEEEWHHNNLALVPSPSSSVASEGLTPVEDTAPVFDTEEGATRYLSQLYDEQEASLDPSDVKGLAMLKMMRINMEKNNPYTLNLEGKERFVQAQQTALRHFSLEKRTQFAKKILIQIGLPSKEVDAFGSEKINDYVTSKYEKETTYEQFLLEALYPFEDFVDEIETLTTATLKVDLETINTSKKALDFLISRCEAKLASLDIFHVAKPTIEKLIANLKDTDPSSIKEAWRQDFVVATVLALDYTEPSERINLARGVLASFDPEKEEVESLTSDAIIEHVNQYQGKNFTTHQLLLEAMYPFDTIDEQEALENKQIQLQKLEKFEISSRKQLNIVSQRFSQAPAEIKAFFEKKIDDQLRILDHLDLNTNTSVIKQSITRLDRFMSNVLDTTEQWMKNNPNAARNPLAVFRTFAMRSAISRSIDLMKNPEEPEKFKAIIEAGKGFWGILKPGKATTPFQDAFMALNEGKTIKDVSLKNLQAFQVEAEKKLEEIRKTRLKRPLTELEEDGFKGLLFLKKIVDFFLT